MWVNFWLLSRDTFNFIVKLSNDCIPSLVCIWNVEYTKNGVSQLDRRKKKLHNRCRKKAHSHDRDRIISSLFRSLSLAHLEIKHHLFGERVALEAEENREQLWRGRFSGIHNRPYYRTNIANIVRFEVLQELEED